MAIEDAIYDTIYTTGETVDITANGRYRLEPGTYAGWTVGAGVTACQIDIGPNVTITSAITMSGTNGFINADKCTTFQGIVTLSGVGCLIICKNGCTFEAAISLNNDRCSFNGGGLGTLLESEIASTSGSDYCIISDCSGNTLGKGLPCADFDGAYSIMYNIKAIDSDVRCFGTVGTGVNKFINCFTVDNTSGSTLDLFTGDNQIVYGCNIQSSANVNGIDFNTIDNSIACANVINNASTINQITILSGGDNNIASGNRIKGAISDSGTGNITSNNEVGAF